MATATTRPISQRIIILELSEEEAETLRCVVRSVAGSPTISRRKHTHSIENALRGVGVKDIGPRASEGYITFIQPLSVFKDEPPF